MSVFAEKARASSCGSMRVIMRVGKYLNYLLFSAIVDEFKNKYWADLIRNAQYLNQ